jgi:hypothetical protein
MIAVVFLLASQAIAEPADLSPFKPFLGACWRADFSPTVHDTHCFEAMYGGAHVRDRHEVQDGSKTIYAGETIYSADGPDLVFAYYNSLGGVGLGKVGSTERALGFTGSMRAAPNKPEQEIDSEWRLIDADHYEVRSLVPTKSGQPDKPLVFTRVPAARPK